MLTSYTTHSAVRQT